MVVKHDDPESARRTWLVQSAELLGGQRALARALDVGERSVRMWIAGDRAIRNGVISDVVLALERRASACQAFALDGRAVIGPTLFDADQPDRSHTSPARQSDSQGSDE